MLKADIEFMEAGGVRTGEGSNEAALLLMQAMTIEDLLGKEEQ